MTTPMRGARDDDFDENGDLDESPEYEGPTEDDLVTGDHVNFYSYGKLALTLTVKERGPYWEFGDPWNTREADEGELSDAQMWKQLDAYMEQTKFWPDAWFISDHGNANLLTRPTRKRRQKTAAR